MARRRRLKNPDEPVRIYHNRQEGILCAGCNQVIPLGVEKTWERVKGQEANYDIPCALRLGKVTCRDGKYYRPNGDERPVVPDVGRVPVDSPVDIDGPEVTPDPVEVQDGDVADEFEAEDEKVEEKPNGKANGKPKAPAVPDWLKGMAEAILPYVQEMIEAKLDEDEVIRLIQQHAVKRDLLVINDKAKGEQRDVKGLHHPMFKRLLETCDMGMHVMLCGPCASGKSTELRNAASELGYELFLQPPVSSAHEIMGYTHAGVYHATPFYHWFKSVKPALLICEEYDASEGNAWLSANSALENRICTFPDSPYPVEIGNARSIAGANANTWGDGATSTFVGRMPQDAASMDRWVKLPWEYDAEVERLIAGNDAWVTRVQNLRANAFRKGLQVVISPRASYRGAKMLAKGWDQAFVEKIEVRKNMSDTDWRSIQ